MFIRRKVVLKLRYALSSGHCKGSCSKVAVYISKCSLQGKLLLSSVYYKESCFKVAVWIFKCSLQGKLV